MKHQINGVEIYLEFVSSLQPLHQDIQLKIDTPFVSSIIGKLINYAVDNDDIEVYSYSFMSDPGKTPINPKEND